MSFEKSRSEKSRGTFYNIKQ